MDRYLKPVPIGVTGELYAGGDGLARGYLNRPDLTLEKFIPHPFGAKQSDECGVLSQHSTLHTPHSPSERLYKTGDLARYLPDGNIQFLGRIDNQVKIRGFRIEPGEIEAVLAQHPAVKATAIVVWEEYPGEKRLVAYVVPHQDKVSQFGGDAASVSTSVLGKNLQSFLREKLPEYMVPCAIAILEKLPLTPNGKVDRKALPMPELERSDSQETFVASRNPLERQLTQMWEKILGVKPIGVKDNFFELGGHSLLAVRLFVEIEKRFGKNLPLATLFQAPTVEELACILRSEVWSAPWESLVAIQPEGSQPPLFCVHGVGGNVLSYWDLAHYLGSDRPVYGLQAQGLDGKHAPLTRIEDMAAHYIKEICSLEPEGPYFLAGHSFGGLVAFEMARQLDKAGQKVALVALLDTETPELSTNYGGSLVDSVRIHLSNLSRLGGEEKLKYVQQRVNWHIKKRIPKRLYKVYLANQSDFPQALQSLLVEESNYQAFYEYVPLVYSGLLTVFRSREQSPKSAHDLQMGWGDLASGGVEVYEIAGPHENLLLEPHVQVLAEKLKACMDKA